ncbi:squalene/phytoene synthase family protein [Limimaricola cinnabarinus]|uniref:squalene/phytoene synthase family protein n=1 Tax=Limimaricola cinnabarinus TaxID=1125964 RepID=UPI002FE2311D
MSALVQQGVEEIVAGSGSSFRTGMRVLPAPRRRAILAVYAFCRVVDDVVDGPAPLAERRAGIKAWEAELARAREGRAETPVGREIAHAARAYDLPYEEFELVLDGMRMDLDGMVAPPQAVLDAYIRRVAGAVGILSMHVFGAWRGAPSRRFALSLAEALQLTNILRDIEEDAGLGRLYLPAELLDELGIPPRPEAVLASPALPDLRRRLAARARAAYAAAAREIPAHSRLRIAPALLMMGPYERLLRQIEADAQRPPPPRARWRKLMDGLRCLAAGGAAR